MEMCQLTQDQKKEISDHYSQEFETCLKSVAQAVAQAVAASDALALLFLAESFKAAVCAGADQMPEAFDADDFPTGGQC